jgi:lipid II:glycine glycyltransferase (peptidoglycan interpeptide bridge formation enzyme)
VNHQQSLQQEIAALQHELRRVNEALERNPSPDMDQRARLLRANIALCERDLKRLASPLQSAGFTD